MPKVLILGATGYIGSAVASSLLRSGTHVVYGMARSPEKARTLSQKEIIPVIGDVHNSQGYLSLIRKENIDVVVDLSGANQESAVILANLIEIGKERLAARKPSGVRAPKLGFIYGSGTWLYGSSPERVNELMPVGAGSGRTNVPKMVGWKAELEHKILAASDVLDTMVVRSAHSYGRESAIWTMLFAPLYYGGMEGKTSVDIPLPADHRPGLCHIDDLASGFHAAVDRLPALAGTGVYPVFDLATSSESMRDILETAGALLGFKGRINWTDAGDNFFAEAIGTTVKADGSRARQLLGWEPKRFSFFNGLDVYVDAWKAWNTK